MKDIKRKHGYRYFCRVLVTFLLACIGLTILNGCNSEVDPSNVEYKSFKVDLSNVVYKTPKEYYTNVEQYETQLIDEVVTKSVYGLNITAVYDKTTIYPSKGDITERHYKVTGIERNGVVESFSGDDYIKLDTKGNVVSLSVGHIMDTDIKVLYMEEKESGLGGVAFEKRNKEICAMVEELLGDIVDWSVFNKFSVEFRSPLVSLIEEDQVGISTYALLSWSECGQNGISIGREFTCALEFASYDEETRTREFFDKTYISGFYIKDPYNGRKELSEYVERIPEYEAVKEAFIAHHTALMDRGYELTEDSYKRYQEGTLTVYNGKVSYEIFFRVSKPDVPTSDGWKYIHAIIPLE